MISELGPKFSEPRPQQLEALSYLFDHRKRLMMAELPTGVGKSAIGLGLGKMLGSPLTVAVTGTLSLQRQYLADFPGLVEVKGRANFPCHANGLTAADGQCMWEPGYECDCPEILKQEADFDRATMVVTNYALLCADLRYGQRFKRRRPHLLVCDEGHRLLDYLTEAESVEINGKLVEEVGYKWSTTIDSLPSAQEKARELLDNLNRRLPAAVKGRKSEAKKLLLLIKQLQDVVVAPDSLVVTKSGERFCASPIWPTLSATALAASANYVMLMSATLYGGEFLMKLLGFDSQASTFLQLPSPFEKRRWPVHYRPVVKLSKNSTPQDWQRMGETCHEIMHSRSTERGIIHVSSYKQADQLSKGILACPECRARLVLLRVGERRAEAVQRFRDQGSAWIIHPGLREGESFDDDLCRIQILAKIPYGDLGDPLVKLRMKEPLGKEYYYASTAAQIAQMSGRGMRSETDYAETYILDAAFAGLYDRHRRLFPEWFRKQVTA